MLNPATTTIERAIRIEPRNATLYYKLALLRLKQSKPAWLKIWRKIGITGVRRHPVEKTQLVIDCQGQGHAKNYQGAKEARAKADGL